MKRVAFVAGAVAVAGTLSSAAMADVAPPPPAALTSPAPVVVDVVKEAASLVENGPNTIATLKKAIEMYEGALSDTSRPATERASGWADVARASLRLGDVLKGDKDKIAAYEKGQAAGKKAVEVAGGKHVDGLFWATANLATIGRTRGVMNSLFMVGDLRKGMNAVLAQNPNYHLARNTLAEIDHAVPGFAGGSDERAEQGYREVLKRDPHFTATMVLLAKLKNDQGEKDEARQWAEKVVAETTPAMRNDWRKFDLPDAKKLLADLQ
jgi:hypothetical protein